MIYARLIAFELLLFRIIQNLLQKLISIPLFHFRKQNSLKTTTNRQKLPAVSTPTELLSGK